MDRDQREGCMDGWMGEQMDCARTEDGWKRMDGWVDGRFGSHPDHVL